jgi:UDP-N-acetylmuramoylalanine--D-glutamate ligase
MSLLLADRSVTRALVYGMGVSGRAATRLLLERGATVTAVDERPESDLALGDLKGEAGIEWRLGEELRHLPPRLDAVVLSPGVPLDRPLVVAARRAGVPVLAEIELAYSLLDGTLLAITGSNGKSTTTALTGALLAGAGRAVEVCGNIGTALSSVIAGTAGRIFVVELSSFQLETIDRFRPHAAALLNLAPDHLDRYPDLAAYGRAKARIFANQTASDVAIQNADDPPLADLHLECRARRRWFSRRGAVTDGCYLAGERVLEVSPGAAPRELFVLGDLQLAGPHNLENAMAAALLAVAAGLEPAELKAGLRSFRGLPHRLELVRERAGVRWFDDSKGTNPAATEKALAGFAAGSVHLILGGRNKKADLATLRPVVEQCVRHAYLIGEAAAALASALAGCTTLERTGTLERAVERAAAEARAGESVVLSPACASFDQFKNFVHRGETFAALVRALPEPDSFLSTAGEGSRGEGSRGEGSHG